MLNSYSSLKNRVLKGMGAQAFGQVVQIFIRICEVPLFLSFLGTQLYGEWLMLAAIPTYLAMGDGGFTTTSCRDITMRAGAGDRNGAIAVYQSTWLLLIFLSLTICFIAFAFSNIVDINKLMKFTAMTDKETSLVFLLLTLHVLLGFQTGLLKAGFWASGHYPLSMVFGILVQLLDFIGIALAIVTKGGPVRVALYYLIGRLVGTIIMWIGQKRVSPWLAFGFRFASIAEIRRLLAPSFASLAFPIGVALNTQGLRLVIGLVLGPSAVTLFVPLRTLSNFVVQPRQVVNRLMEPEMALAFGAGNKTLYQKLFLESVRISFWSCLSVALFIIPASQLIFPLWTSGHVDIHWPTFLLLLFGAVMNSIWLSALMVAYSTNRHGLISIYYMLIYGFAFIILAYLGTKMVGPTGAAGALFLVESVMVILIVQQALKLTNLRVNTFMKSIVKPPLKEMSSIFFVIYKKTFVNIKDLKV